MWFDSRFESGNLSEAYLARDNEYDLWIEPDFCQDNHRQWFFFSVSNTEQDQNYTFNILNFEKKVRLHNSDNLVSIIGEKC